MRKLLVSAVISTLVALPNVGFSAMVDGAQTVFQWTGKKITSSHTGKLKLKEDECKIVLDKNNQVAENTVLVMDMNSVNVEDIQGEMNGKFLAHVKNEDFLEVEKFPTSKLVVKKVEKDSLVVDLTVKGITNQETVKFTKNGDKYEGVLVFDRTKYNIKYGSKNFFKSIGDKAILDDVEIKFSLSVKI